MNSPNFLEEFFDENRDAFLGEEPSFGHFNRFARKLEKMHDDADKDVSKRTSNFTIYGIAAGIFLIIFSVGIFYMNSSQSDKEMISRKVEDTLPQDVYPASAESLQKMNELEVEYIRLKFQYSLTHDSSVLAKIRENLNKRVNFVETMRSEQSLNSYTINASHEQCCGFGNEFNSHNQRDLYGQIQVSY